MLPCKLKVLCGNAVNAIDTILHGGLGRLFGSPPGFLIYFSCKLFVLMDLNVVLVERFSRLLVINETL